MRLLMCRKSFQFATNYNVTEYDEDEGFTASADVKEGSHRKRPKVSLKPPLLDKIKKEPDESCVLPTDSVIELAVRERKKTKYTKVCCNLSISLRFSITAGYQVTCLPFILSSLIE